MSQAIIITGATGKQGGSVVNALLAAKSKFEIIAVTRNPQSPSAQKIVQKSPNVKVIQGNLDDPEAIFRAAEKVTSAQIYGVFSVQVAIGDGATAISEERQGKALIDAALNHNVKHFVYSSVDRGGSKSDTTPTEVPHFKSKYNIEQHLFKRSQNSTMEWTVLRPAAFYENLVPGFMGKVFSTAYQMTIKDRPLQMIATSDIGFFAAEAFTKLDEYKGVKLSLAGDELTFVEYKQIFEEKTGQNLPTTFRAVVGAIQWAVKDFGIMFKWFYNEGYGVDIASVKKMNPKMKDFGTWLVEESQFKTL